MSEENYTSCARCGEKFPEDELNDGSEFGYDDDQLLCDECCIELAAQQDEE